MARQAMVLATTCTLCTYEKQEDVAGPIAAPFTFTPAENGGFSFSYDPDGSEESEADVMHLCKEHADDVLPKLEAFRDWLESRFQEPLNYEETYQPEEADEEDADTLDLDGLEDSEAFPPPFEDEEDVEAVREYLRGDPAPELKTASVGTKIMGPSNPTPEQVDEEARIPEPPVHIPVGDEWKQWYERGYVPSDVGPKTGTAEHAACKEWYEALTPNQRVTLDLPERWPTARMRKSMALAWHKSQEYARYRASLKR